LHRTAEFDGLHYVARPIAISGPLPPGYHRLTLEPLDGVACRAVARPVEMLLVSAPRRLHDPYAESGRKVWGAFLPAYAVRSARNWGCGDLTDVAELGRWIAAQGGSLLATLPLLASYLDAPFDPSPYAPVSRVFWNELYVDVRRLPELEGCEGARRILESEATRLEIGALRAGSLVDYRRQARLKRTLLQPLARWFFESGLESGGGRRGEAFRRFLAERPDAEKYAAFRAAVERHGGDWRAWPARMRDGALHSEDYDEDARRYHLYVQWVADEQMRRLAEELAAHHVRLYLDLPLGVHPDGYDAWREREGFVAGVSVGAPPDPFFSKGQDWGFAPPHPERERESGYRYTIRCLRHHLRCAGLLRIDHIMGLHRLFWIPRGAGAANGVYVGYRAEEQYAILALESERHRALVVGEDLGTVPAAVRETMERHGVYRMFVVPFELAPDQGRALPQPPAAAVASLNTHDMATFRAFWQGLDIADRMELRLLDTQGAQRERQHREALREALLGFLAAAGLTPSDRSPEAVLRACLAYLAKSDARVTLLSLEDLWGETRPQNTPGTGDERPNWRRKAERSLEDMAQMPEVAQILGEIGRLRSEF
ncbi:MAG: 4-alpha-glucanotransferase, partial [Gemmatimonadetes bacterium]|nr:4-alpha-glucanotransferase [Gemmatimonadota bacterium]